MNKRKAGVAFVGMGAVLILSALLLFLYNEISDSAREKVTRTLYRDLQAVMEQRQSTAAAPLTPVPVETTAETTQETSPVVEEPQTVTVQGYECIGILEIPALALSLPVLSDWTYEKLEIAPCRQFGSASTDDLVIAGHNYKSHFKYLYELRESDEIRLYDTAGREHTYEVVLVQSVQAEDVDAVQNSGYDLVLYTCTYSGSARTAVFCNRIDERNSL